MTAAHASHLRVQRRALWIRIIYALCLAGATINHVRAVLDRGWFPDQLAPATALYWSGLTFADPLAVVLLFLRPRAGIALTGIIILSNVAHNLWFLAAHPLKPSLGEDVIASPFMLSQIAFLLFVAVTAPIAWRGSPGGRPAR
jgi:hypothetical protein